MVTKFDTTFGNVPHSWALPITKHKENIDYVKGLLYE
jgi:hypothetical protein